MLTLPSNGSCQCGSCSYLVTAQPYVAYTCHCRQCQRLSGSAFLACMQVPAESLVVISGEPRSHERLANSGNTLTTWSCPQCASPLFLQNSARPRIRTVCVGTLNHPDEVRVSAHIWTIRKLPWVVLPAEHRNFPEGGDWTADYAGDIARYKP